MKYIAYCRKSTDEKDKQVLSIDSQIAELTEFASREKLEIVEFVGISTRTNHEGAKQIGSLLTKQGFEIRIANVQSPFLHIGGAMSVVDIDTILSVEGLFPDEYFQGFKVISVPNDGFISGNVITLGNRELIVNKENKVAIKRLREAGFILHEVDLGEFTKGTGGPSCLIMPLVRSLQ